jgi:sorting nexin-8
MVVIDVSIEHVAALSSQSTLPEPTLDLTRLQPSMSTISTPRKPNAPPLRAPLPSYSSEDPWNSNARFTGLPSNITDPLSNGMPSTVAGSGLPKDWWKKQENIKVTILGQQGFILNRYMVYEISSEVCCTSLGPWALLL